MRSRPRAVFVSLVIAGGLVAASGCSSGDGGSATTEAAPTTVARATSGPSTSSPTVELPTTTVPGPPADAATLAAIHAAVDAGPADANCDLLDTRACYLPYPSNAYTVEDPTTKTGRRVAMAAAGLPANAKGVHIDPTEWNRNDGFSPNSSILTYVPGLDPTASKLPSWTDLGASLAADAPVRDHRRRDGQAGPPVRRARRRSGLRHRSLAHHPPGRRAR